MKTSLDHLPERKREELARIVSLILERVQPEMIILFGSHINKQQRGQYP